MEDKFSKIFPIKMLVSHKKEFPSRLGVKNDPREKHNLN